MHMTIVLLHNRIVEEFLRDAQEALTSQVPREIAGALSLSEDTADLLSLPFGFPLVSSGAGWCPLLGS
jgi:hypothetical protein